jgi:hypothetical protein
MYLFIPYDLCKTLYFYATNIDAVKLYRTMSGSVDSVPGWVTFCGNSAPFAAIAVFLAVSDFRVLLFEYCTVKNVHRRM